MSRFCFVTFEFHPVTPGGCGVFIYNASIALLEAGHSVHILIDCDESSFQRLKFHPLAAAHPVALRFHHVTEPGTPALQPSAFRTVFEWSAYRFNEAAKQLDREFRFDFIEWFDYCGVAYYATREKLAGTAYRECVLAIRLHNTLEVMDANDGAIALDTTRAVAYAMERAAIADCDLLLSNGRCYYDMAFARYYPDSGRQVVHCPPPLFDFPALPQGAASRNDARAPLVFLFYGRLYTWKGADLLAEAALQVLDEHPDIPAEFHFVGYDSNQPPTGTGSYKAYLESKIPQRHRARFVFHGQCSWDQLGELLANTSCAVFPCYFESFCYAAHELDACRIPLLLSRIPAFLEFFRDHEETDFFDLNVASLARTLADFAASPRPSPTRDRPRGGFGRDLAATYAAKLKPTRRAPCGQVRPPDTIDIVVLRLEEPLPGASAPPVIDARLRLFELRPAITVTAGTTWFLGRLWELVDAEGQPVPARSLRLGTHLLICRTSDRISETFLDTCLAAFRESPDIGFVGTWLEVEDAGRPPSIDCFALDALHPVAPWLERDVLSRHLLKTLPGTLLADLFDYRLGSLGEAGYLQALEDGGARGLTVPRVLLSTRVANREQPSSIELSHFLVRDTSPVRARLRTAFQAAAWTQGLRSLATENRFSGNVLVTLVRIANRLAVIHDRFPLTQRLISWAYRAIQKRA